MNMTHAPVVRRAAEGRTIGVVGDLYRFLAVGAETDGRYALWEAIVQHGGGPPPHIHSREEEWFYVLEGEITFQLGGKQFVAKAGTFVNMPIGSLHAFTNKRMKPARMLISVAPAGLEQMFFEIGQPVEPGAAAAPPPRKEDIEMLLAVAPKYGIEIKPPRA
jgi:quercetin dioxygenase-like cupin family protein